MGCAQSRNTTRSQAFGTNMNTVPYAFKMADATSFDSLHPFDVIVSKYAGDTTKEAKDMPFGEFKEGKFEKADKLKEEATKLFNSLKELHTWAKANVDEAKPAFGEKYKRDQVTTDLHGVLDLLHDTYPEDLKMEEAPKEGDGKDEKKDDKPADAADEEGKEGGKAEDLANNLVLAYTKFPVFADMVKQAVVAQEIVADFDLLAIDLTGGLIPMGAPKVDLAFAASLIFVYVNSQERPAKECFWSANFTDEDKAELDETFAAKDTKVLVFPGVIHVFGSEDDAKKGVTAADGDAKAKNQITFKYASGKAFEFGDDKALLIARFVAKVESYADGVCTLADAPDANFDGVKAWAEKAVKKE